MINILETASFLGAIFIAVVYVLNFISDLCNKSIQNNFCSSHPENWAKKRKICSQFLGEFFIYSWPVKVVVLIFIILISICRPFL
jgi:flagellar biosynthesis protein FlhB